MKITQYGFGVKVEVDKRIKRRIYNRVWQHRIAEMFARKRGSN